MHADACAVLTVTDALDMVEPGTVGAGIETVLDRLDAALGARPRVVIADLWHVDSSRFVIGLLSIMRRRAARAGAALVLVGLSVTLRERLDQAGVSALYTTFPSVANALLVLGSVPAHGAVAQVGPDAPIANDGDGTSTTAHDPPRTSG
jgi:anti-anti-sigma regulatory factor